MSDLISRQAAIDAVIKRDANCGIDSAEVLKDLPSAQPERKTGRWILTEDDDYEYCTCSECGYQNGENWMNGSDIPFCAMCGADMRGDDHADDRR